MSHVYNNLFLWWILNVDINSWLEKHYWNLREVAAEPYLTSQVLSISPADGNANNNKSNNIWFDYKLQTPEAARAGGGGTTVRRGLEGTWHRIPPPPVTPGSSSKLPPDPEPHLLTSDTESWQHATTSEEYSSNSREIEISVLCCARKNEKSNYNFINCSKNRRRLAYYIFQILWSSLIKKNGSKRDETVEKGVTYHWWSFELPLLRRLKLSW